MTRAPSTRAVPTVTPSPRALFSCAFDQEEDLEGTSVVTGSSGRRTQRHVSPELPCDALTCFCLLVYEQELLEVREQVS